jgi:phosphoribosyl-dephospho-CoA transferase
MCGRKTAARAAVACWRLRWSNKCSPLEGGGRKVFFEMVNSPGSSERPSTLTSATTLSAALRRHQLVWLAPGAWQSALAWAAAGEAPEQNNLAAIGHWAAHDLPLVVTRQACDWAGAVPGMALALGLPLPHVWGRKRLRLDVREGELRAKGAFPAMADVAALLPLPVQTRWASLASVLGALGVGAEVYGSVGWQRLTGLAYLREGSDIDLLLQVATTMQADAAVAALHASGIESPRLDGELVFPDGSAVAWREWAIWRAGLVEQVLIKRLDGPLLARSSHWALWGLVPEAVSA